MPCVPFVLRRRQCFPKLGDTLDQRLSRLAMTLKQTLKFLVLRCPLLLLILKLSDDLRDCRQKSSQRRAFQAVPFVFANFSRGSQHCEHRGVQRKGRCVLGFDNCNASSSHDLWITL
jgi:hypothetical protein